MKYFIIFMTFSIGILILTSSSFCDEVVSFPIEIPCKMIVHENGRKQIILGKHIYELGWMTHSGECQCGEREYD